MRIGQLRLHEEFEAVLRPRPKSERLFRDTNQFFRSKKQCQPTKTRNKIYTVIQDTWSESLAKRNVENTFWYYKQGSNFNILIYVKRQGSRL